MRQVRLKHIAVLTGLALASSAPVLAGNGDAADNAPWRPLLRCRFPAAALTNVADLTSWRFA
jgi:hypothetical protein